MCIPFTLSETTSRFLLKVPEWSQQEGFRILATVEYQDKVLPVSFAREYSNFRSFYASMGHQASTFVDPQMKHFITGAILWTVRRDHLLY